LLEKRAYSGKAYKSSAGAASEKSYRKSYRFVILKDRGDRENYDFGQRL
jgi:hypothetical protein